MADFWRAIYYCREIGRKRKKSYLEKLGRNRVRSTKLLCCSKRAWVKKPALRKRGNRVTLDFDILGSSQEL
jgi:hypothetical protein